MKRVLLPLILASLLSAAPALAQNPANDSFFATTNVNLRSGPSTGDPIISTVRQGDPVRIHTCLKTRSWCDISWNGRRGWIASNYIASDRPANGARGTRPVVDVDVIVRSPNPYGNNVRDDASRYAYEPGYRDAIYDEKGYERGPRHGYSDYGKGRRDAKDVRTEAELRREVNRMRSANQRLQAQAAWQRQRLLNHTENLRRQEHARQEAKRMQQHRWAERQEAARIAEAKARENARHRNRYDYRISHDPVFADVFPLFREY